MEASGKYLKMTGTPVERLVCSLAVPATVSMLITNIYNIADTYFVGRLDTQSCAAVGVTFAYMSLMQAISFFFGHGSGNFISRALGARKESEAATMASTGFFSALIVGLLIALCSFIAMEPVLRGLGATDTVLPYAERYFRWILVGTPFIVGCFVMNNQMRFQGNANLAMVGILSGAVINIGLDPLLIFRAGMGVEGAGLATAISQAISFTILFSLSGRRGGIRLRLRNFTPSRHNYTEIVAGGLPSLARQGLMAASAICLNNCAGHYGDEALAAFAIVSRIMHFVSAIIIGFGQGYQPVCGFNFGAGLFARLRKAFRFCVISSTGYCLAIAALGIIFAPGIISVFRGEDPEVVRLGTIILRAQCLTFPGVGFVTMANMHLQTTRQTFSALTTAIARHGLFFIPVVFIGNAYFGVNGLIAAHPVADFCALCIAIPITIAAMRRTMPVDRDGREEEDSKNLKKLEQH